jgi:hypothetical protein
MRMAWSFFWLGWYLLFRPFWRLPLRFGWSPTTDQFMAWGDVLGLGFAVRQSWPAITWLDRRGITV